MKTIMKFNKSILYMAFAAATFGLAACSTDGYWDEAPESAMATYTFEKTEISYSVSASEPMTEIPVTLTRSTSEGTATLPITGEFSEGLSGDDSVTFEDGHNQATYYVKVGEVAVGVTNTATLAISEDVTSVAGSSTATVSYKVSYNWVSAGQATFYNYWFESIDEDGNLGEGVQVEVQKAVGANGLYRLVDPFYYAGRADGVSTMKSGNHFEFYVDEATGEAVSPANSANAMGYTFSDYGDFYFFYSFKGSYGCAFFNQGNVYTVYGVTAYGTSGPESLYDYDTVVFEWNESYPW
jgi:hypothetical protein